MKVVVMGGFGRVGASLLEILGDQDMEVVAASRRSGVDAFTGAGLRAALAGADVVVDVMNSPSFADDADGFFETATANLLAAEAAAGVRQHIALSIVGAERLTANGYFRAKHAQEQKVRSSAVPHTILRATQFFEFLGEIANASEGGREVRLAPARVQPVAADDVAIALSKLVTAEPLGATVELAGPDSFRLDAIVSAFMAATGDQRPVLTDPEAPYFGTRLSDETLMAGDVLRFGYTDFDAWLRRWVRQHPPAERPIAPPAAPAASLP